MNREIHDYLARIGREGGKRSRRRLDPHTASGMARLRDARRAFRQFHASCFWSYDPAYRITMNDISWVADQLMKHGGRAAWDVGARLCR